MTAKPNVFLMLTVLAIPPAFGEELACTVSDGVYRPPGSTSLQDALKRDPLLKGRTFTVDRRSGRVAGSPLFANGDGKVEVTTDIKDTVDRIEVLSVDQQRDVKILTISRHEGSPTFTYYFSFFGLLLTGTCASK
jgi:hypothetical protein